MARPKLSGIDRLIVQFDNALRATTGSMGSPARPSPGETIAAVELAPYARNRAGRLMRVNHCGEVCAQALYLGQADSARSARVAEGFEEAAMEEKDHLSWCEDRIRELDSHVSYLNPFWYGLSYSMGLLTGLLGDRFSLGFVAATEEEVCKHLDDHLQRLPPEDLKSKKILEQMRIDERKHATNALASGGIRFPRPLKRVMHVLSGLMTGTTYWV